jgi:hypothetical protein
MSELLVQRVEHAIQCAIDGQTKLEDRHFTIEGMSTKENRILLNELVKDSDKYLEIGVHKGSTFVSALFNNNPREAYAIDNFSQFGDHNTNKNWFEQNCSDSGLNYKLIDKDCFNLAAEDLELLRETTVYFYDGDHREEDQKNAFTYYYDILAKNFIIIIDDWNHLPTQNGTRAALMELHQKGAKVHKEWILNHQTSVQSLSSGTSYQRSWHNGLFIAVIEK